MTKSAKSVVFRGQPWSLSHLDAFTFSRELPLSDGKLVRVDVLVIFSCHCFTHGLRADARDPIPEDELYQDEREVRVLNPERYELSRELPEVIGSLHVRRIVVAEPGDNYVTFERMTTSGMRHYGVFFSVERAKNRKNRLVLRVQSAYLREPTKTQSNAKKVRLDTLLKAAFEGRKIRP